MKRLFFRLIQVTFFLNLFIVSAYGQEPVLIDTVEVIIQAIPVTEIIIKATDANTQLREKRTLLLKDEEKAITQTRIDSLLLRLSLLRENSRIHRIEELNLRSLENLESDWSFMERLFDSEQETLNQILQKRENQRTILEELLTVWKLTDDIIDEESAADLVLDQINITLKDIRETQALFEKDSKFIQELLVEISTGVITTNEVLEDIELAKHELTRGLLSLDSPPLWKEFSKKKDSTIVFQEQRSLADDSKAEFRDFYGYNSARIFFHLALALFIIIAVFIIFRNLRHTIPESDSPEILAVKNITARPLASGWLISLVLTFILYNDLPDAVTLITSILLLPPLIIILRAVITGPARKIIFLPLIAIVLVELNRVGYSETLFSRLWLLAIDLFGMAVLAIAFGRKAQREIIFQGRQTKLLISFSFIAFGMLLVAFFANIAGAITLAEFLVYSVVESITISLFVYALVATLHSIITTIVHSDYLKKSRFLSKHKDLIFKRLKGLINLIAILLLINFILRIFNIWDPVFAWVRAVITHKINVGSMEFSLWDIFLFFFILWITIQISRLIRNIFEAEAGLRDRMRRGAPGAVSLLLRITTITIGFMLAIAAAGIKMDKLAILLGAFGVGIGFGLQNIFNNLVSGIILAFERPIKEGDIIEFGTLLGIVKEIGIRSSIVRTYDGSEVIVPNGNLISNELINWTRTDMLRRGEVKLGVAYGTDPQMVIDLLIEATKTHKLVLEQPQPVALFHGFGDSSLDFRLLFWLGDADLRLQIQSEMTVLVNNAIVAAGITIPFPQRDLHVKSLDPNIIDRVKAQDEIAKNQTDSPGGKS